MSRTITGFIDLGDGVYIDSGSIYNVVNIDANGTVNCSSLDADSGTFNSNLNVSNIDISNYLTGNIGNFSSNLTTSNLTISNNLTSLNQTVTGNLSVGGNLSVASTGNLNIGSLYIHPNKKSNLTVNNCYLFGNEQTNTSAVIPSFTFTSNSQNGYVISSSSIGRYSYPAYYGFNNGTYSWWSANTSYNADGSASGTEYLYYGPSNTKVNGDWLLISCPLYFLLTNVSFYNDDGYLLNHTIKSVSVYGQRNDELLSLLGSLSIGGNPPSKGTYNFNISTTEYFNKFYFQVTACSNWSGGGVQFECAVKQIIYTGYTVGTTITQNIYCPQAVEIGKSLTNALITDYNLTVNGDSDFHGNVEVSSYLKPSSLGILFPYNVGGGTGDSASIKYYAYSGEQCRLELATANDATDHIYLNPSGGVGIATGTPSYKFHVNGTAGFQSSTYLNGAIFASGLGISTGGVPQVVVDTNSSYVMQRITSSKRYKKNIENLPETYNKNMFMNLRPVIFEDINRETGQKFAGFIAEEVDEIGAGIFCLYQDDIVDSIDYARLTVILVKQLQETIKEIELLKEEIENLKNSAI